MSNRLGLMLLYLIASIVCIVVLAGCNVSKSSPTIDMMKTLPSDTNLLVVFDYTLIAEVSNLRDILINYVPAEQRQDFKEWKVWTGIARADSDVGYVITKYVELDDVPDLVYLRDLDYRKEEYDGAEIWSSESRTLAFLVLDDMVVFCPAGNAKSVVDCSQEKSASMYDDKDIKPVVDDLPIGVFTMISREVSINGEEVIAGITLRKIEGVEENLEIIGNFNFKTEARAEHIQDSLKDYLVEKWYTVHISSHQKGKIIKIEGQLAIENFEDLISTLEQST